MLFYTELILNLVIIFLDCRRYISKIAFERPDDVFYYFKSHGQRKKTTVYDTKLGYKQFTWSFCNQLPLLTSSSNVNDISIKAQSASSARV